MITSVIIPNYNFIQFVPFVPSITRKNKSRFIIHWKKQKYKIVENFTEIIIRILCSRELESKYIHFILQNGNINKQIVHELLTLTVGRVSFLSYWAFVTFSVFCRLLKGNDKMLLVKIFFYFCYYYSWD